MELNALKSYNTIAVNYTNLWRILKKFEKIKFVFLHNMQFLFYSIL